MIKKLKNETMTEIEECENITKKFVEEMQLERQNMTNDRNDKLKENEKCFENRSERFKCLYKLLKEIVDDLFQKRKKCFPRWAESTAKTISDFEICLTNITKSVEIKLGKIYSDFVACYEDNRK